MTDDDLRALRNHSKWPDELSRAQVERLFAYIDELRGMVATLQAGARRAGDADAKAGEEIKALRADNGRLRSALEDASSWFSDRNYPDYSGPTARDVERTVNAALFPSCKAYSRKGGDR